MFDSCTDDMASDYTEPLEPAQILDDDLPNYSFEDVYPEDVEQWRSEQIELNERESDEN